MGRAQCLHFEPLRAYFEDMTWLKKVLVDLIVTAVILLAVITELAWARWAVIIYTPFMLLLKVLSIVGGSFTKQFEPRGPDAPAWAYHLLYAINVAALVVAQWWLLAGGWAAIWLLSYIQLRQSAPSSPVKSSNR